MPELPEVECIRRSLASLVQRRAELRKLVVHRAEVVGVAADTPPAGRPGRSRPATTAELRQAGAWFPAARVTHLARHGKELRLDLDRTADGHAGPRRPALLVQLGMTGSLRFNPADATPPDPHTHVTLHFEDRHDLHFRDPRRFGGLWLLPDPAPADLRWARLGPDALAIRAPTLARRLAGARTPVKAALLDQQRLAGLGNIYADEALHRARLAPRTLAGAIDRAGIDRLAKAIRQTLRAAIEAGGSTLRDYAIGDGSPGRYQHRHRVYGRAGLPCRTCRFPLASTRLAGRQTVWCPRCQPGHGP